MQDIEADNNFPRQTLEQVWQIFSTKDQRVTIFSFAGCVVSVATTQLCCGRMKAATVTMETEEHACSFKTRQNQAVGCMRSTGQAAKPPKITLRG